MITESQIELAQTYSRVIVHGNRLQLLAQIADSQEPLSPSGIAGGDPVIIQRVLNAVRHLRQLGMVELVAEVPSRGSIRHDYQATDLGQAIIAWVRSL